MAISIPCLASYSIGIKRFVLLLLWNCRSLRLVQDLTHVSHKSQSTVKLIHFETNKFMPTHRKGTLVSYYKEQKRATLKDYYVPLGTCLIFTINTTVTYMFCWPCIIVYQYIETKVMHFLFNLLRIKGL
jgi:hypothetical protein